MSRVLVVGDPHEPFSLAGYLAHCQRVYRQWKCNRVVFIGDLLDQHAHSYHEHDPDGMSAGDELKAAAKRLKPWKRAFPKAHVTIGNHDQLVYRKAFTAGIAKEWLKDYNEVYGLGAGWNWVLNVEIDGVLYTHGTGNSGPMGARNLAIKKRQSVVIGHIHSHAGVVFHASERDLIWGMNIGCGVDASSYAARYGRDFPDKPVISCGVVLEGFQPYVIPMDLGAKYPHRR